MVIRTSYSCLMEPGFFFEEVNEMKHGCMFDCMQEIKESSSDVNSDVARQMLYFMVYRQREPYD